MGALRKPETGGGAIGALFDALHELHHRAGWPSLRTMAKDVACSHTTVSAAFSGPGVPRWGLTELLVEALDGDVDHFRRLWLAASSAGQVASPAPAPGRQDTWTPPRQLPADVAGFTGRTDQLAELDRVREQASTVGIAVVSGTAGVGKTALAVHWAHRVVEAFPDGQLYVDLRGYDPDKPVQAAEALEVFLRGLGVAGSAIPHEVTERAARYRTLLADRRVLVLLDNVHTVDQVRDLLPGSSSCFVVVTSRQTLPALVARHGAVRIGVGRLPAGDAVALLRTLIGARVTAEPDQADALAQRCARLPLALRIAAELTAALPGTQLGWLIAELGDETRRLDLLGVGHDEYTAVRAVFSWSLRHLNADATRVFQLLGLHPGRDVDADAAAALTGTDLASAQRLLGELARAHLVEVHDSGRFGMHDLLRAYAVEQAGAAELDRDAALTRLLDHHLRAAEAATAAFPQARAWLEVERPNLLAVAAAAPAGSTFPGEVSATLAAYLDLSAHYDDALTLHGLAYRHARAAGDRAGEGVALNLLGAVYRRLGHHPTAVDHHRRALAIHREVGNLLGESRTLNNLGTAFERMARYDDAHEHFQGSLAISREVGSRLDEGVALHGLGVVHLRRGRHDDARDHLERAIAIGREVGAADVEIAAHNDFGEICRATGQPDDAMANYRRALTLSERAATGSSWPGRSTASAVCAAMPATCPAPGGTGSGRSPSTPSWVCPLVGRRHLHRELFTFYCQSAVHHWPSPATEQPCPEAS